MGDGAHPLMNDSGGDHGNFQGNLYAKPLDQSRVESQMLPMYREGGNANEIRDHSYHAVGCPRLMGAERGKHREEQTGPSSCLGYSGETIEQSRRSRGFEKNPFELLLSVFLRLIFVK